VSESSTLETLVKRDRAVVLAGLAGVTGLAWAYLFITAAEMGGPMDAGALAAAMQIKPWTGLDFLLMFLMWAVMMVAMMLPSAAPMILLFAAVCRKQAAQGRTFAPVGVFVAGYLAVWSVFSLGATVLQWGLEQAALLSPLMVGTSPLLGGGLLVVAGLYQWSPLKQACLRHCRSPIHFIVHHRREGPGGAFVMGLEHGAFCVGCCWLLMGLLLVGGVMNLLWVAAIAVFVLLEKVLPFGARGGRVTGALLVLAGSLVLFQM
jgi:predicted metal-binding membrane protein